MIWGKRKTKKSNINNQTKSIKLEFSESKLHENH